MLKESDLRLNEVMTFNVDTLQDSSGDFDPWVEITNLGPGEVRIQGLCLSDEAEDPTKWPLPSLSLGVGEFALLWLDGEGLSPPATLPR